MTIDADGADRRLDNFLLTELKGLPRTRIYRLIRKGEVRVNKGRSKPAYRLVSGDVVRIPPLHVSDSGPAALADEARSGWILTHIIFEDERLLVLDKPSGLAVHGGSGVSLGAIELLRAARPESPYLELVHRLDRDTSGCLLVAKKRSALRSLHEQMRAGEIDKRYQALLVGRWQGGDRNVELPLEVEHRQGGERHVRVSHSGKAARTVFRPQEIFAGAVLCEVQLFTGRTHQIRVHAAALGLPVAGDNRYGADVTAPAGLRRLFLHAGRLGWTDPLTGRPMTVTAALPAALESVLAELRRARD
ncbi:MAG: RluA family pseudouridine synthase [Gammaproteobacteria bacterium]|nr:RluA family pseudouridine synthase [Gammaproteobacteria bacterium]